MISFFFSFVDWQKERMNLTIPDEHISVNIKKLEKNISTTGQ